MKMIRELYNKYKSILLYGFFGVCTTLVNWISYFLLYEVFGVKNVPATIVAWILAVAFAFLPNKIWVFNSRSFERKVVLYEMWTFVAARLATGVLDVLIMYVSVDLLHWHAGLWKLLSNIIVIIANYALSKIVIFKAGE
ncbi:MAG: GtrA family protein [Lachnospiraceae bacterium]|nr:GtrA family protein [Lachnospiraceae bacterium]